MSVSGNPDFNSLPEEAQRQVAERLLKIKESGWKPFWCPDPVCTGDPHVLSDGTPDPMWSHNHARQDQRLLPWGTAWVDLWLSGRGCVAPWTLIDLADGTRERIDRLAARGEAVEVMTPDGPAMTDGAPFIKGFAHQWRVRLSTGRVLTVTDAHRMLAPGGWLRLDHVRVGQPLVAAETSLLSTDDHGSRAVRSELRSGVHRCWRTELGSGCGCPTCRRQGDLPLPDATAGVRGSAPSPTDAGERNPQKSGSGDPVTSPECSHACPREDPHPRSGSSLCEPSLEDARCQGRQESFGSSPQRPVLVVPSRGSTDLPEPTGEGPLPSLDTQACDPSCGQCHQGLESIGAPMVGSPCMPYPVLSRSSCLDGSPQDLLESEGSGASSEARSQGGPSGSCALTTRTRQEPSLSPHTTSLLDEAGKPLGFVTVESIEYSHWGPFYDMTVPLGSVYTSEGLVHHNSGKTESGANFITLCARKGVDSLILGRRGTELINTHVARIKAIAHPDFQPEFWASKDLIEWPNGSTTFLFSAEKPENIRSVNVGAAWVDEAGHMDEIETAWMNLKLATRIETPGNPIHILVTSTPTPSKWMMAQEDDPDVSVRRVSTYANKANLSSDFLHTLEKEYEGTRMGRQELHGEVLRDVEGALWNEDMLQHDRLDAEQFAGIIENMDDRVVAVDPAGSANKRSDETGIIGGGAFHFDDDGNRLMRSRIHPLIDATLKGSPSEWAAQVFKAARLIDANRIVAEKNFGGDMVKQVLSDFAALNPEECKDSAGQDFRIEVVNANKSKETRAEGTVNRYEQGSVVHSPNPTVFGDLSALEKEMLGWVPKSRGGKSASPNRVDALVWMCQALDRNVVFASQVARSSDVVAKIKKTTPRRM